MTYSRACSNGLYKYINSLTLLNKYSFIYPAKNPKFKKNFISQNSKQDINLVYRKHKYQCTLVWLCTHFLQFWIIWSCKYYYRNAYRLLILFLKTALDDAIFVVYVLQASLVVRLYIAILDLVLDFKLYLQCYFNFHH